ncbi:ABC transporter ATP-binding protein [Ekhidna sp.]|uniref:ABC transporter ATP-binding protein n=1 Tax=Ekhidna sp. TaxID=2608089 RepID=UPI003B5B4423
MVIRGENIGKKFGRNWIFRHQNFEIEVGAPAAITGKNGAGKSTLLQILSGYLTPSEGDIYVNETKIDEGYHEAVFVGPYTEITEEFTLKEFLEFHSKFKKCLIPINEMAESASLPLDKHIAEFSTGMKQRSKLLTAFFFENELVFMDEPTSNLDREGFDWWEKQILKKSDSIRVIASNDRREIDLCEMRLDL